MPKKIVQKNSAVLRQIAGAVPVEDIGGEKITKILQEMNEALDACLDGVAIAAPQIGVLWRIFIVSGKALSNKGKGRQPNQIYINPVIKKLSSKKVTMEEGCLSVRWLYGETRRADKATVEAYNERGHKFVKNGSGLLAQIFQHEMDHLNGILFIDKASNRKEVKPTKTQIGKRATRSPLSCSGRMNFP